jgi:hypothetical protein
VEDAVNPSGPLRSPNRRHNRPRNTSGPQIAHLGDQIAHFGDQIAHLGDQLVPTVEYIYIRKVMVAPTARSDSLFGKSAHEEGDEVRQSLTLDVASSCASPPPKTVLRNIKNVHIYV